MMIEYYLAGGGLRLFEIVVYSSLWIVIGCFTAAIFRQMLGPAKVKKLFADGTRWGLIVGWLMGMLLPVCSLGVIPVVRELHRMGVSRGTIVAFGLTAPLFNPMSVLYGLTLSDPIAILSFSLCALVIVTLIGTVWNRIAPAEEEANTDTAMPVYGIKRSLSVFYTAARETVSPTMGYIVIGMLGSALLATFLPKAFLQDQVSHDNWLAPISVAFVATPIYSTPLLAMSQIGGMFQHGNSIGAAFSLLILGAGLNLGLFCWFGSNFGVRRMLGFFAMLFTTTISLAYLIDKPLYPKGVDPAGHSHAFDVYSNPFLLGEPNIAEQARTRATEFWQANEFGGTTILMVMIVFGTVLTVASRYFDFESWFTTSSGDQRKLDREVPGWLLGTTILIGLIASSVAGCYLYYPSPNEALADLRIVNTEAVLSARNGKWEAADKWIGFCDDLSRRLEIGVFLREGKVGEFQSAKAKVYREKLDQLKELVERKSKDGIEDLAIEVSNSYTRLTDAFKKDTFPLPPAS